MYFGWRIFLLIGYGLAGLNAVPSDNYSDRLKKFEWDTTSECLGKDYCTIKPKKYPDEIFNEMFQGYIFPYPDMLPDPDLNILFASPEEEDMCLSRVSYEPIYTAVGEDLKNYMVVQAPGVNYHQSVRLEVCSNTHASCFNIFPKTGDIKTSCVQGYTTWSLLAADGNGTLIHINATLPSCCSCKLMEF